MIEKLTYEDIETIFLVGFALVFYFLERLSPKHRDLDVRTFGFQTYCQSDLSSN